MAVVVEDDHLKEPASAVGTDVEVTIALPHYADGVADCVLDVVVGNTVLAGVVRDLRLCRLPCLKTPRKLSCAPKNQRAPAVDRCCAVLLHCRTNVLLGYLPI